MIHLNVENKNLAVADLFHIYLKCGSGFLILDFPACSHQMVYE